MPLNAALPSLLSPASPAASLGSDTHPQANAKSGALGEQSGGRKVTANLSGTVRGRCLQRHCCVRGTVGPFPPHLGDSERTVLVPQGCLGHS